MIAAFRKPKWLALTCSVPVLVFAISWVSSHSRSAEPKQKLDRASQLLQRSGAAPWSRTERELSSLQESVRDNPKNGRNKTLLGTTYLQKARETGDPTYLSKAE